jgi:ferredoxin, 2Fe-2S
MPMITYVERNGHRYEVEAAVGTNVMCGAVDNSVPGIDGDCGGNCACATCHVYVDEVWTAKTGPRTSIEEEMLGFTAGTQENSRLGCQIEITPELDGLVVHLPEGQH